MDMQVKRLNSGKIMEEKYKRVHIISYGCQMSKHDGEVIAGRLERAGFKVVDKIEYADAVIFTTCTVRQHAEDRLIGRVHQLGAIKNTRPFVIGVGGCLAQKEKKNLFRICPEIDFIFGTQEIEAVPAFLKRALNNETGISGDFKDGVFVPGGEAVHESKIKAFVSIMKGCNNFCSYCIVPYTRGREVSRSLDSILDEIKNLAEKGYKEVTLLGQNVNSYNDGTHTFYDLLYEISKRNLIERVRFTTSHPKDLSLDVIKLIGEAEILCEHIHLPVQSGSNKILHLMNRKYTREKYLKLIEQIRKYIKEVAISTDILVGFPQETEKDFEETLKLVKEVRFDLAYTFYYSPRPGTAAANKFNKYLLPLEDRKQRLKELIKVQNEITYEIMQSHIGKEYEILVEGYSKRDKNRLIGRNRANKLAVFEFNTPDNKENLIGKLVKVKVVDASMWTLFCKRI